jgi:hypothetical protein
MRRARIEITNTSGVASRNQPTKPFLLKSDTHRTAVHMTTAGGTELQAADRLPEDPIRISAADATLFHLFLP